MSASCPFCRLIAANETLGHTEHAAVLTDAYPLAPGHLLVVPRRHVADIFTLPPVQAEDLWRLVHRVGERYPMSEGGVNIGVNVGALAGQTIDHAHVHLIPRRLGDVADPRGGVRWVLPERAAYWAATPEPGWGQMLTEIRAGTDDTDENLAALLGAPLHRISDPELPRLRTCWQAVVALTSTMTPPQVRAWWITPHPGLDQRTPLAALADAHEHARIVACAQARA